MIDFELNTQQRMLKEALQEMGKSVILSLIHISEPTRPY